MRTGSSKWLKHVCADGSRAVSVPCLDMTIRRFFKPPTGTVGSGHKPEAPTAPAQVTECHSSRHLCRFARTLTGRGECSEGRRRMDGTVTVSSEGDNSWNERWSERGDSSWHSASPAPRSLLVMNASNFFLMTVLALCANCQNAPAARAALK